MSSSAVRVYYSEIDISDPPLRGMRQVAEGSVVSHRVASIKQRVATVAAANRHTVAVLEGGHVYSWGCNLQGQLGYGTSDSGSNAVPRIVEAMKVSPAP